MVREGLVESKLIIADCRRILLRIGSIDAVDPGTLQQCVSPYFQSPESRTRVGGEERIARTSGNEGHTALFQYFHGIIPHIVLCHRLHRGSGEHLGVDALLLYEHREGKRIDDGGKHSHLVPVHAVEALSRTLKPAENIAAAIDYRYLETGLCRLGDFFSISPEAVSVKSLSGRTAEALATQFQKYPSIHDA